MPVFWSINWIDKTFTSRSRTEELLRPELDNSLTPGDFEKALEFLPGRQRHWEMAYSSAAGLLVSGYGQFVRKPAWSFARAFGWTTLAGLGGHLLGQLLKVQAHARFIQSLENEDGFMKSLSNVSVKLGSGPLGAGEDAVVGFTELGQSSSEAESTSLDTAISTPPLGRWDEIRIASARNAARNSSWDTLRQVHERDRVAATVDVSTITASDRAQEQARFDTTLDAERKSGSS